MRYFTMIKDYPLSDAPVSRLVGRELLAVAASALLYPFGVRRPLRRTKRCAEQRTVVLVHGYLANRSTLWPLSAYLRVRGVRQLLDFNYPSGQGIERAAIALREYLRVHVRGGRIDLVCHSMGGLVARVYLQELGGARRVDRCITLGTPHQGTYNAYWVASRVGRQLRPDSALLSRLRDSRAGSARVHFTSIAAGADNIVIPRVFAGSAGPKGPQEDPEDSPANEEVVHLPDLGHVGMLFSPRVFDLVANRLLSLPPRSA